MKLKQAVITILINQDYTMIELYDNTSATCFAEIKLTPAQLSSALSRLGHTPCEIEVFELEKLNKKHEVGKLEFEIPEKYTYARAEKKDELKELANKACPEGWVLANSFNSQDSFFHKDGKYYARCIIRRWV